MDFYDISAKDWAKDSEFDETMGPILKDFLSDLPKGSKLLDIGCGTGYESKRMASLGYEVTAFDFSSESMSLPKHILRRFAFLPMMCASRWRMFLMKNLMRRSRLR
ncbi:MAG: methyltransferase domain-containing protein [Peptostreptococcaceae bacterium]|nr:methyltransferase domain-containing protein [Peptostreptococcaceae bacterium]